MRTCFAKSRYFFRVIADRSGKLVGYWHVVPIERSVFHDFCNQNQGNFNTGVPHYEQHKALITEHAVPYKMVDRRSFYLYLAGLVVPRQPHLLPFSLGSGTKCVSTILDLLRFLRWINIHIDIVGLCGYQDSQEGQRLFERFQFEKGLELDPTHTIYSIRGDGLRHSFERINTQLDLLGSNLPKWIENEKLVFKSENNL